jgi:hypothetical protein
MSEFRWAPHLYLDSTPALIEREIKRRNEIALRRWQVKRELIVSGNLTPLDPRPTYMINYYDCYYRRLREAACGFLSRLAIKRQMRARLQRLIDEDFLPAQLGQQGN